MLPKNVTHFAKIVYMGLTPPPFSPLFKNCNIIVRGHPRVFISILLKIDALCDRSDMWHCNVAARGVAGTLEGTAAEAARCEWKPLPAPSPPPCPASVERLGPSSQDATQGMSSIFHSIRVDFQLSALTKPSQCH